MKISANKEIASLTGDPIKDLEGKTITIGRALANILLAPRQDNKYSFDKVRILILAQEFYKEGEVELEKSEVTKLEELINSDNTYGPLISGSILMEIEDLKKLEVKK